MRTHAGNGRKIKGDEVWVFIWSCQWGWWVAVMGDSWKSAGESQGGLWEM